MSTTLWRWTATVVLLIAFLRMGVLLVHSPLIGMANNYDMIRVQGCIDAYPIREEAIPPWSNSWQAPIERYRFRDDVHPGCFFTSEALFAFAAWPLMQWQAGNSADSGFSLRTVGWVKFLALVAVSFAFLGLLLRRRENLAAVAHSLVLALVLADPAVTLYFNTFYAEFAAVFFAYVAIMLIVVGQGRAHPRFALLVCLALAVALAVTSKVQHLAFGFFLLVALSSSARFGQGPPLRRLAFALAAGAIVGFVAQALHLQSGTTRSMRSANLTNTVLAAVLKNAADPHATAVSLGLPERCGDHAGKDWYVPGIQQDPPCPELLEMSRVRLLRLALVEPSLVATVYFGGVQRARPWITNDFGLIAQQRQGRLPTWMVTGSHALDALPFIAFCGFLFLPAALAAGAYVTRLQCGRSLGFVLVFCALYPPIALAVVVFGDGLVDVAKQFHLGTTAAATFWVLACLAVLRNSSARTVTG